jgi:hypothetical protein
MALDIGHFSLWCQFRVPLLFVAQGPQTAAIRRDGLRQLLASMVSHGPRVRVAKADDREGHDHCHRQDRGKPTPPLDESIFVCAYRVIDHASSPTVMIGIRFSNQSRSHVTNGIVALLVLASFLLSKPQTAAVASDGLRH